MDQRLREIAESLAKDVSSGASEMMSAVLNGILAIPDDDMIAISPGEWEDFAEDLHKAKPSIAPIFNVANTIMLQAEHGARGIAILHDTLLDMLERERRSGMRIAEQAVKHIEGSWFMTTSYSSTVAQVLKALSKDRGIKITVAEASPGGEGRQFARVLAEHMMEAEIIYDSTIFARMEDVDGAITGADSVTPSGLVNKVGTRVLAEAARAANLPVYAVCGWSKVSPVVLTDLVVKKNDLGLRLSEHVQVFESTPLDTFTSILTDQGTISAPDLKMELRVRKVARAWYARGVLRHPDAYEISTRNV